MSSCVCWPEFIPSLWCIVDMSSQLYLRRKTVNGNYILFSQFLFLRYPHKALDFFFLIQPYRVSVNILWPFIWFKENYVVYHIGSEFIYYLHPNMMHYCQELAFKLFFRTFACLWISRTLWGLGTKNKGEGSYMFYLSIYFLD